MSRLTEEMVIARSKQSDIGVVKKLNCWGSELTDVSIIRRMRGVEVLALSVNKISTLAPFEECLNLQELYLRKNNIQDINDLAYLQNLPKLKFLWLEENPCVDMAGPNYRAFVLRALPNLKKLDNVEVTPEEVDEAMRRDIRISPPSGGQPQQQQDFEIEQNHHNNQDWQESSPSREQRQSPENTESECISDPLDRDASPSSPSQEQRSAQNSDSYLPAESNHPPQSSPRYQNNNANNSRGQQYQQYDDYQNGRYNDRARIAQSISTQSMKDYYQADYQRPPPANYRHSQHDLTEWNEEANSSHGPNGSRGSDYSTPRREKPDMFAYRNGNSSREELDEQAERRRSEVKRTENRIADSTSVISNTVLNHLHGIHRRPVNRNSNLLSATLCLVKELDYPSLEVVEHAVRCRIDELTE